MQAARCEREATTRRAQHIAAEAGKERLDIALDLARIGREPTRLPSGQAGDKWAHLREQAIVRRERLPGDDGVCAVMRATSSSKSGKHLGVQPGHPGNRRRQHARDQRHAAPVAEIAALWQAALDQDPLAQDRASQRQPQARQRELHRPDRRRPG